MRLGRGSVIRTSAQSRVWKEAASWRVRMEEPRSEREVDDFEAWLARDPAHAVAYSEMEAIQSAGEALPRSHLARADARHSGSRPMWRPALALATAALVVVAAFGLWQGMVSPAFATISNTGSAVRGYRLPDGTSMFLDTGTEVGVSVRGDRREIEVRKGRARIRGGSDSRPLEVAANGVRIIPGNAQFDLSVDGARVSVTALDGELALTTTDEAPIKTEFYVPRRQAVSIDDRGRSAAQPDFTWPLARVRFDRAPLGKILVAASRTGDPDILAATAQIASLPVTGVLDLRDPRRLARKLAAALDLRVIERGDRLVLSW